MFFASLHLRNFQKHGNLRVVFDKHITSIIGDSDKGKSTILRALRWVCLNKPAGNRFLRHGAKSVSVKLVLTDGTVIQRSYGPHGHVYKLDGQPYKAFGRNVPEPIQAALRLDNVNFQWQHEGPFWFSSTPGEVARQLNAIVDLRAIDTVLSALQSNAKRARVVAEERACDLEEARKARRSYAYVPKLAARYKEAKGLAAALGKTRETARQLRDCLEGVSEAQKRVKNAAAAASACETALVVARRAAKVAKQRRELDEVLSDLAKSTAEANQPVPDLSGLQALADRLQKTRRQHNELAIILDGVSDSMQQLSEKKTLLAETLAALDKLRTSCGKRCPLCGNVMK
jgi:chromosome segregation ATPase